MLEIDNNAARSEAVLSRYPKYGARVKIGNWNEDLWAHEYKHRILVKKMCKNELLVQQTREMMQNLCQASQLTTDHEFVKYGNVIQINCPEIPMSIKVSGKFDPEIGLFLSGIVTPMEVAKGNRNLSHGSGCALMGEYLPCVRNTFIFWPTEPEISLNTLINYGDEVYICLRLNNDQNNRLYLSTSIPLLDDSTGANNQYPVSFSAKPDRYCRWVLEYWDQSTRPEYFGTPVPANQKLRITNLATGRMLACEHEFWFLTFFGQECSVTCHTFRSPNRKEMPQNLWQICTKLPVDRSNDLISLAGRRAEETMETSQNC